MKLRFVCLLSLLLPLAPLTSHAQESGLAERRAIAAYAKDIWPAAEKSIQDAAAFPVAIELNLNSLALAGYADSYADADYLKNTVIEPLIRSFQAITIDEMGKTALKDKLKSVTILYDEKTAPASNYADGLTFEDGKLTINWKPFSNAGDIEPRTKALTTLLESKL